MQRLNDKPHIMILATGGTIAGVAQENTQDYTSGVLPIDTLLESLPKLQTLAHIHTKQICNIDSANMSDDIWLMLDSEIRATLADPLYSGVVITHGTDTMEESAFFVHLVSKSQKPIVFTGAMRHFYALDSDGGRNLYNALLVAIHSEAAGVMVCLNGAIFSALDVSKTHTLNLNAFSSPKPLGYIANDMVHFYTPPHPLPLQGYFHIESTCAFPRVDILYSYSNDGSSIAAKALFENGTKGLVIASSGAGSIHKEHKRTLIALMQQGLVVVISSRINQGRVQINKATLQEGFISAKHLNPQKARVLLMLALSQGMDRAKIAALYECL
ncbi:asparaginase [Helicobacter marmotae]|uniref:Probable L-asparaginase n=1 Tax=Helicobacter marmotae TaxID=152490 RepID=A0A3D8I8I5_9HELI|nr:asparaginase [Helicobacter marmotae]RDU61084.1 asparaginase [Helicobacter marmotae]